MPDNIKYPNQGRYTLQWLVSPYAALTSAVSNNTDATFKETTRKPKPSDLLLHYNYGAAAVKRWGRGTDLLVKHAKPPCPPVPVAAPAGPSKTKHDRAATIDKAWDLGGVGGESSAAGARRGGLAESEDREWDEDDHDVMLFFWGNSPAATSERHLKKVNEDAERMKLWMEGVY